ncbi:MAG: hypothetical protein N3A66_00320, partial [Planctomycetota bacterium]|nr:hypothetical protein [Planctomycetota bacterium]
GYEAGMALMTLVEAYERCGGDDLKKSAQACVAYAVKTQKAAGGWDYTADGLANNSSVSGWWIAALAAARKAGLEVPAETLAKARAYMEKATNDEGRCSYSGVYRSVDEVKCGGGTPFLSALALTSLTELGSTQKHKMDAAAKRILARPPVEDDMDFYLWAWQAWSLYRRGETGAEWQRLRGILRPILERTQIQEGENKGSWEPGDDRLGQYWGRIGQTAFGAIIYAMLESG